MEANPAHFLFDACLLFRCILHITYVDLCAIDLAPYNVRECVVKYNKYPYT